MTPHLPALEAIAKAATPGPWGRAPDPCHYDTLSTIVGNCHRIAEIGGVSVDEQDANAAYIAAANPETVLALIEMIRALEAERDAAVSRVRAKHCPEMERDCTRGCEGGFCDGWAE